MSGFLGAEELSECVGSIANWGKLCQPNASMDGKAVAWTSRNVYMNNSKTS